MATQNRRVRAIGGIFFRWPDPKGTREWYQRHLGLSTDATGTNFAWRHFDDASQLGFSQWSPFSDDTRYFGKEDQQFMINYRVEDLEGLLTELRFEGVKIVGDVQREPYGAFAHIIDIDGRMVELWEPIDSEYEKMLEGITS
jgi:catechol 2,3-dioxygenase-like lactoylglutathione lyase family enzyme